MKFSFSIKESNKFNLVKLQGQLIEKHQGDALLTEIDDLLLKDSGNFILDLSELTFINEAGLEIIISVLTRARTNGGECIISTVSPELESSEIFKTISELFIMMPDINSAQGLFVSQH